jgi:hypothetical protein
VARNAQPDRNGDITATAADLVAWVNDDGITISRDDED